MITLSAQIENLSSRADRSWKIVLGTQELTPNEIGLIGSMQKCWLTKEKLPVDLNGNINNMTQVELLRDVLLQGIRIDRVQAFHDYGIADLRSRLSDVKRVYGMTPQRRTKPGKNYREYWMENKLSV